MTLRLLSCAYPWFPCAPTSTVVRKVIEDAWEHFAILAFQVIPLNLHICILLYLYLNTNYLSVCVCVYVRAYARGGQGRIPALLFGFSP